MELNNSNIANEWETITTSDGTLHYCQPKEKVNSNKIIGFDLDWTMIGLLLLKWINYVNIHVKVIRL